MSEERRIRTNAKQTSKGEWYFDVTAETDNVGDSTSATVEAVRQLQEKFINSGHKIVKPKEV